MTGDVVQEGNTAGGHISGRDTNITHNQIIRSSQRLADLVARCREELEGDSDLRGFIDDLLLFTDPIDPSQRPDLKGKMERAHRGDEVPRAVRLKELFWKRLDRNQFSPAAQEIYAFLLGLIQHRFRVHVVPLIRDGADRHEINDVVEEKVVGAVFREIDENPLTINIQQIRGMLYYLTGNCHVRWDARW